MKRPYYRLVVVDSRKRRDGRCIENVGTYNPLPRETEVTLREDRILHWLGQGAQLSGTVEDLVRQAGLLERFQLMKTGTPADELEARLAEWKAKQPQASGKLSRADKRAQKKADERAAAEAEKTAAEAPAAEAPAEETPAAEAPAEEAPAAEGEDAEKAEG